VWNTKNAGKRQEYDERWNRLHPERRKEIMRTHDSKRRTPERLAYKRERIQDLRERVFRVYGDKCVRCGFNDKRALQLDHVLDNGAEHRRGLNGAQNRGSSKVWRDAVAEYRPDLYQILCANCNWIKRAEVYARKKSMASAAHA
jgi:succinate dehydrogenase/fumarate reductase flavoprotein subunit